MARHEDARIRQGTNVIRVNVVVDFSHVQLDAPEDVEWGGRLLPPNNTGLEIGQTYTLELPGFKPGKILIAEEADSNGDVAFKGIGALPVGEPQGQAQGS